MIITHKINMDLSRVGISSSISVMQDDRYSRNLEYTLTENGAAWAIPDGATALIRYLKPDGTGGNYDALEDGTAAYTAEGNVLTVALAPQVCTVPGKVLLTVAVISGEAYLHTFTVTLMVQRNPGLAVSSENYFRISGALADSGWTPNMYLGTDENGNVVAVEIPDGAGLTEEQAAKLDTITLSDGYTDISGLRQATDITAVRDGQTITITTTVQGDVTHTDVVTLDDNDYPIKVVSDGVECTVSWEGF